MYLHYDSDCIFFMQICIGWNRKTIFSQKRNRVHYIIHIYFSLEIFFISEYIKTETYKVC